MPVVHGKMPRQPRYKVAEKGQYTTVKGEDGKDVGAIEGRKVEYNRVEMQVGYRFDDNGVPVKYHTITNGTYGSANTYSDYRRCSTIVKTGKFKGRARQCSRPVKKGKLQGEQPLTSYQHDKEAHRIWRETTYDIIRRLHLQLLGDLRNGRPLATYKLEEWADLRSDYIALCPTTFSDALRNLESRHRASMKQPNGTDDLLMIYNSI